jgi:hypothetical protein
MIGGPKSWLRWAEAMQHNLSEARDTERSVAAAAHRSRALPRPPSSGGALEHYRAR